MELLVLGLVMGVVLLVFAANALVMHEQLSRRDRAAIILVVIALALVYLPA